MSDARKVWVMVKGYAQHGKWWPFVGELARVTRDGAAMVALVLSQIERAELSWFTFQVEEKDGAIQVHSIDPATGRRWDEDGLYRSMPISQLRDKAANAGWHVMRGDCDGKEVYHVA